MEVSKEYVICPHCKTKHLHLKSVMFGDSGLINRFGTTRNFVCRNCEKEFECEMVVDVKFKTKKVKS